MFDCFNRKIDYLRVSVTDRCNFRCTYCMPEEGIHLLSHDDILSFDEIINVITYSISQGITKIRITGGEPLVRKGIVSLIEMISRIDGIEDLSMTTNGKLLGLFAKPLKEAGLQRVNVSLDTLNPQKFRQITRIGELRDVLTGIEAAQKAGLNPIKLNCVIKNSPDEEDALHVASFAKENGLEVRFIYEMDLGKGTFTKVVGGYGGHCATCNRLRLTANGYFKPCLFNEMEFSIKELGIDKAFEMAINKKPKSGYTNSTGSFYNIGG